MIFSGNPPKSLLIQNLVIWMVTTSVLISTIRSQQPFSANSDIRLLEPGKPIEREIKSGEVHSYQIVLAAGQFLRTSFEQRGVDVIVRAFAPDSSQIAEVDSPNGAQGIEPITVVTRAAGTYRFEVRVLDKGAAPGRYEVRIDELLTVTQYKERLATKQERVNEVTKWLNANALNLRSIEAESFGDLQPLKRILKDVRIVGLGEATHGTREFFLFKQRMLEFLVREMNFRVLAIEASHAGSLSTNDYITGQSSDRTRALQSLGFWTLDTEEMGEVIDWLRAYNMSGPKDRQVKFVGIDIQRNEPSQNKILAYLKRVSPEYVSEYEKVFKLNLDDLSRTRFRSPDVQDRTNAVLKLKEARDNYSNILTLLELRKSRFIIRSSQVEFEEIRNYVRLISQYLDAYLVPDASGSVTASSRDYFMADNIRRLSESESKDTKLIFWGHNEHIRKTDENGKYTRAGYWLKEFFGDAYYAIGLSFSQGGFQANGIEPESKTVKIMSYTVGEAPEDSIDWYLARTGKQHFFVNLGAKSKPKAIAEWESTPYPLRFIGSEYNPNRPGVFFTPVKLVEDFDGLVFFATTTRARPNPWVKNVAITTR